MIIDEITKLTDEWYILINSDHHKDRDCHWHIDILWSYGNKPVYTVQHFGYILHDIVEEFDSYDEALIGLKKILIEKLEEEKKTKKEVYDENEW